MTNPSYDDLKSPSRGSWRIWLKFDYFTEISPFNTGQEPEVTYDLGPLNSKLEGNLTFTISPFQLKDECARTYKMVDWEGFIPIMG